MSNVDVSKLNQFRDALDQAIADECEERELVRMQLQAERAAERAANVEQLLTTITTAFPVCHKTYGISLAADGPTDVMLRQFNAKQTFRNVRVTIGDLTFKATRHLEATEPRVRLEPTTPWGRDHLTGFARFIAGINRLMPVNDDEQMHKYFSSVASAEASKQHQMSDVL